MVNSSRGRTLARLTAIASSVLLVSLYIVYRSGGQTQPERIFYGSKSAPARVTPSTAPTTATNPTTAISASQLLLMSSSKSARVITPQVFGGSKSAVIVRPEDDVIYFGDAAVESTTKPSTAPVQPSATKPAVKP